MRTEGHNAVPSRIPDKLTATLAFHFSAIISQCRNKKTDRQKDDGQKDRRHL